MMSNQTKSSISTVSGRFFDILDPWSYEYDIEEIAESLSKLCRYTGHTAPGCFYSVAEHSVLVSRMVPDRLALTGLLHDASEAFLGDVSSPLKALLSEYKKIENNVQEAIAAHYGLEYPFPKEIHEADKRMYWNERLLVAPGPRDTLWHQEFGAARKVNAVGVSHKQAKKMFINRYNELIKKDGKEDERSSLLLRERAA